MPGLGVGGLLGVDKLPNSGDGLALLLDSSAGLGAEPKRMAPPALLLLPVLLLPKRPLEGVPVLALPKPKPPDEADPVFPKGLGLLFWSAMAARYRLRRRTRGFECDGEPVRRAGDRASWSFSSGQTGVADACNDATVP